MKFNSLLCSLCLLYKFCLNTDIYVLAEDIINNELNIEERKLQVPSTTTLEPVSSPRPTYEDFCYICGSENSYTTLPDAIADVAGTKTPCGQLETAGRMRLIPNYACSIVSSAAKLVCNCIENNATDTSTSSAPISSTTGTSTSAPITSTTGTSSSAPITSTTGTSSSAPVASAPVQAPVSDPVVGSTSKASSDFLNKVIYTGISLIGMIIWIM